MAGKVVEILTAGRIWQQQKFHGTHKTSQFKFLLRKKKKNQFQARPIHYSLQTVSKLHSISNNLWNSYETDYNDR